MYIILKTYTQKLLFEKSEKVKTKMTKNNTNLILIFKLLFYFYFSK